MRAHLRHEGNIGGYRAPHLLSDGVEPFSDRLLDAPEGAELRVSRAFLGRWRCAQSGHRRAFASE
jgi:hypothetical protein